MKHNKIVYFYPKPSCDIFCYLAAKLMIFIVIAWNLKNNIYRWLLILQTLSNDKTITNVKYVVHTIMYSQGFVPGKSYPETHYAKAYEWPCLDSGHGKYDGDDWTFLAPRPVPSVARWTLPATIHATGLIVLSW